MSIHGCINRVMNDSGEDEEGPITFKRPNSSSKQVRSSYTSQKTAPQKHDGLCLESSQIAYDSRLQNNQIFSTAKATIEKPSVSSSSSHSSLSALTKHSSNCKSTTSHVKPQHQDESIAEIQNSDDSDDDKPLSHRLNSVSVAVQKKFFMDSEKIHKHSSDHYFAKNSTNKMIVDEPIIKNEESNDSDDNKPLSSKISSTAARSTGGPSHVVKLPQSAKPTSHPSLKVNSNVKEASDDSEDEKPLISRFQSKIFGGSSVKNPYSDQKSLSPKLKFNASTKKEASKEIRPLKGGQKRSLGDTHTPDSSLIKKVKVSETSSLVKVKNEVAIKKEVKEDDNDHIPIAQRMKKSVSSNSASTTKNLLKKTSSFKKDSKQMKKKTKDSRFSKSLKVPPGSGGGQKWTTLEHNGVIFPPPYKPHGVKMLYNGQPVVLTPEQEEVSFKFIISSYSVGAADFIPMLLMQEKKAVKEEKMRQEEKYMWAIVDGVKEKVNSKWGISELNHQDCFEAEESTQRIEKKLAQVDAKIEKMELDKRIKEDLKTVALGTSKINYLDPRISVAWCKRHEVPIEKVSHLLFLFLKSLGQSF
ncbi:hypothetical protein B296_00021060 [Ensete ventricosum]|uniref:DNA topoisomerase I eukaryotic-type domain-containing protein n=1 Tax=Ensete ventricosum TaxID=4639 RepID=A0A427ANY7_ENSVE|nr:hypothetical protein B296_00021060 [Ensete ventricosum]